MLQTNPWLKRHARTYILFLFNLRSTNCGKGGGTIFKWVPHHVYDQIMRTQTVLPRFGWERDVQSCSNTQIQDCSSSIIIYLVAHEDIIMIGIVQDRMIRHQETLDFIVQWYVVLHCIILAFSELTIISKIYKVIIDWPTHSQKLAPPKHLMIILGLTKVGFHA